MAKEGDKNLIQQQNGFQTLQIVYPPEEGLSQVISIEQVPVTDRQTPVSGSFSRRGLSYQVNDTRPILNLVNHIIHLNPTADMKIEVAHENDNKSETSSSSLFQPLQTLNHRDVVYVNPKQYSRILKRRVQRQKLISEGKISSSSERRKYLHESRHQHAVKRTRGSGGRFSSKPTSSAIVDIDIGNYASYAM